MGLRDRIKQGLKRALGGEGAAPAPVSRAAAGAGAEAARADAARAEAARAEAARAEAARAEAARVEAAKAEAAKVEAANVEAAKAEAARAEAAKVEAAKAAVVADAPPVAEVPASKLPKSIISDNDAPLRDAHLRGTFNTTGAGFVVRLLNPALGIDLTVPCEPGEYVLEAADRAGYEMPASCRTGGCLTCAGKLVSGDSDMIEQYTLEEEHIAAGYRLLCCTTVSTDATFVTHQQDEIH